MARKRMFDNDLINQDDFYDLPMEAKALYFLLGMEADDEGFINPKKVLRLYGGTEDSIKILILKKYLIPFQSGVVVITDWKRNNYLDKNKVKETIYVEEKELIGYDKKSEKYILLNKEKTKSLTEVKPKLNQSLRSIEESSIEEYRVEESSKELLTIDSSNNYEMDNETLSEVCNILQKEFGRLITPIETEKIKTWEYSLPIIKLAIAEAVTNGVFYIKYIDSILFNWKKANVRSVGEAENYIKNFRQGKGENVRNSTPIWFNKEGKIERTTQQEQQELEEILEEIGG